MAKIGAWLSSLLGSPRRPYEAEPDETVPPTPVSQAVSHLPQETEFADPQGTEPSGVAEGVKTADWSIGDLLLGLYEVTALLGEGGMGKVYKVHHRGWKVDMAVKVPKPSAIALVGGKENLVREAETWVNMSMHAHTVNCFYVRMLDDTPHIFAEFVEGGSLADWIRTRKLYEGGDERAVSRILDVAIQCAWGLHHAHAHGLTHRDVKPANVMMAQGCTAKVTDFGLAQAYSHTGEASVQGRFKGGGVAASTGLMTPAYCSPEQAAGKPLTLKTDIWSWGLSVLEMFAGGAFWAMNMPLGMAAGQLAHQALEIYVEEFDRRILPRMPDALVGLLRRCFRQKPAERPVGMHQIADELREIYARVVRDAYPREEPEASGVVPDSLNNRALSLLDLGKQAEAERLWEQALEFDPHHLEATYNCGLLRWWRGAITDTELLQQLEAIRHSGWNRDYLLSLVHLERGDLDAALPLLEGLQRQAPDVDDVRETLNLIHSGRFAAGRCIWAARGEMREAKAVSLSADNSFALVGGGDHSLQLWDMHTGRCVRTFVGHEKPIRAVCLSTDGRYALSGGFEEGVHMWDVGTEECLRVFDEYTGIINSLSLSEDGNSLLCGTSGRNHPQIKDAPLFLWEVNTGRCERIYGDMAHVSSCYISRDGSLALSAGFSNMRLWDLRTRQLLHDFEVTTGWVNAVCLSHDERLALSGHGDNYLKLWDLETGREIRTFRGPDEYAYITSVSLSPDGRRALSGDNNSTARLWDVAAGRCLRTFRIRPGRGETYVCFSADGGSALMVAGGDIKFYEVSGVSPGTCSMRLSRLWTYNEVSEVEGALGYRLVKAEEAITNRRFGQALTLAREARDLRGCERSRRAVDLWAELSGFCPRVGLRNAWLANQFEGHTDLVHWACLSADGSFAISGGGKFGQRRNEARDNSLKMWEVPSGRCMQVLTGHTNAVYCGDLSADGTRVLSGGWDFTLRLWDTATAACLQIFTGHEGAVRCAQLSPDGRLALSSGDDKTVRLWETATGRCLRTLQTGDDVLAVCLSADGRLALFGGYSTLALWDIAAWQPVWTIAGSGGHTRQLSFSGDGRFAIIVYGQQSTFGICDLTAGHVPRRLGHRARNVNELTGPIDAACWSADGRFAFSGGEEKVVRMWEVGTGQCSWASELHGGRVSSVSVSADGRWALSGSWDKTLRLWQLDWELEPHELAEWDEGARPYLENFLSLHTPYATALPRHREPTEAEIRQSLTHCGNPSWSEHEFEKLLRSLQHAGYGWLNPASVRRELECIAAESSSTNTPGKC